MLEKLNQPGLNLLFPGALFIILMMVLIPESRLDAGNFKTETIRVAVIDRFDSEELSTVSYVKQYFQGLDLAQLKNKNQGVSFEYKYFGFGKNDLEIRDAANRAEQWNPHVIIGPRFSNLFLLLSKLVGNRVVISPLASATKIYELPENFYTLSPSNEDYANALVTFAQEKGFKAFKPIAEADCAYCTDLIELIGKQVTSKGLVLRKKSSFVSEEARTINIENLKEDYHAGDAVVLPNRSSTSGMVMARFSDAVKSNVIFLGADDWGHWGIGYIGKFRSKYQYKGYYTLAYALQSENASFKEFSATFEKEMKKKPESSISLISYSTLETISKIYTAGKSSDPRARCLEGLSTLTKDNKASLRPHHFSVFEIDQNGERYVQTIMIQ